ncbi:hypothetical protein FZEAL_5326 [Fusarium zealandicum]|uniref:AB hydrolase-1 domain-containing protein n=1 Tax=Fusarium zealandicum TaxID=1053134 RepID=A0A8H4UJZ4_9HYPO|nr:hypothetical protein FZEAL_5326 [Fusarium zealandicum]
MADSSLPIVEHHTVVTTFGDLELLGCSPVQESNKSPILCLHGAFCSADDYSNFLPFFAAHGYPAYSLSLRGHGKSWTPSWLAMTLLTTLEHYVADITAAANFIAKRHPETPHSILVGHSFGGGHMQYLLAHHSQENSSSLRFKGLVLLASAPLSGGGKEIMSNWEMIEAGPDGYKYPWSPRSQLETAEQVRAAFFQPNTSEEAVNKWLVDCRTTKEGIRTGISVFWPFGEAGDVLKSLDGLSGDSATPRKILLIVGLEDRLVKPAMVEANADAYRAAVVDAGEPEQSLDARQMVMNITIKNSAHHLMMNTSWETCASRIIDWIEGRGLDI